MTAISYSISEFIDDTITLDPDADYEVTARFEIDGDPEEVDATLRHVEMGGAKLNRNIVSEIMGADALLDEEHRVRDHYEAQL